MFAVISIRLFFNDIHGMGCFDTNHTDQYIYERFVRIISLYGPANASSTCLKFQIFFVQLFPRWNSVFVLPCTGSCPIHCVNRSTFSPHTVELSAWINIWNKVTERVTKRLHNFVFPMYLTDLEIMRYDLRRYFAIWLPVFLLRTPGVVLEEITPCPVCAGGLIHCLRRTNGPVLGELFQ